MYLLDTDHLSVLERGGTASQRLRRRLQVVPPDEVAATVVSYEEQTRGWLSYIAKVRSLVRVHAWGNGGDSGARASRPR